MQCTKDVTVTTKFTYELENLNFKQQPILGIKNLGMNHCHSFIWYSSKYSLDKLGMRETLYDEMIDDFNEVTEKIGWLENTCKEVKIEFELNLKGFDNTLGGK